MIAAAGVPVAEGQIVTRHEAAKAHLMPPPYVIKPVAEGFQRRGLHRHRGAPAPAAGAIPGRLGLGDKLMVERYVAGKELTCAVMGDKALDVIEIVPATRFYDYEAKYAAGGSSHILPAPILPNVYQEVRSWLWLRTARLAAGALAERTFATMTPGERGISSVLRSTRNPA